MRKGFLFFIILAVTMTVLTAKAPEYKYADFPNEISAEDEEDTYYKRRDEKDKYLINVRFSKNKYSFNDELTAEIRIHCIRDSITFTNSQISFENFLFRLYDENNNYVYSAPGYTLWKAKETVSQGKGSKVISLNEGEFFSKKLNLKNWFSINKKGRYRIEGRFNPSPTDEARRFETNFSIRIKPAYFYVEKHTAYTHEALPIEYDFTTLPEPGSEAPHIVLERTLAAQQTKNWDEYFRNVHIPSFMMISRRYENRYEELFNNNDEDFSDEGVKRKYYDGFKKFLRENFETTKYKTNAITNLVFSNTYKIVYTISMSNSMPDALKDIEGEFGKRYMETVLKAYQSDYVNDIALRYELAYRTALPNEKAALYDEFRKYFASAYDRELRLRFIYELRKKSYRAGSTREKNYYKSLISAIEEEHTAEQIYSLDSFEIRRTEIKEIAAMQTAYVDVLIKEKYIFTKMNHTYREGLHRRYTLKKLGDYWYVVDYVDVKAN